MSFRLHSILAELAAGRIPSEDAVPPDLPETETLRRLLAYLDSVRKFSLALANGDLSVPLPARGGLSGSLKSLHASLKHLTWQAQRIAEGDFSQRVDFMGEFSGAFNRMVERLDVSRGELENLNLRLRQDNIDLRDLSEALRESEARFRHIAENVSDVIWTMDCSMTFFTYISPSIANLCGLSVAEALREPLERSLTPESLAELRKRLTGALSVPAGGAKTSEVVEVVQICPDGRCIPLEVVVSPILDADGRIKEFVGISRDISARKKAENLLRYQSTHDALTGLYNRAFFEAELERVAAAAEFPLSFIVADLDGLKSVNDTLGHDAGDRLIKGAAEILRLAFRSDDVIIRIGGDEFVVMLPATAIASASLFLERIRTCADLYNAERGAPAVGLSLGSAAAGGAEEIASALQEADRRMYADKASRKRRKAKGENQRGNGNAGD
ncbi:MAG: diguanylate cyclase [Deltaproteobacteria bacterium]|nr:diguanylate cyclase [Deltaproteobacteria bacterium]